MILSNTSRELFQTCARKYHYKYNEGLKPKEEKISLVWGDVMHFGFGKLYDTGDVDVALKASLEKWEPYEGMDTGKGLRNRAKLEETLRAYDAQFFGKENWEDQGGEKSFGFDISPKLRIIGKIDRIGLLAGNLAIQEWKHSASPGFFVSEPNNQLVCYLWLASMALGKPINKIIVTIANLYKTSKDGLVPPKVKTDPPKSIFIRDPITVEPFLFDEFKRDMLAIKDKINICKTIGYWEKNAPSACGGFGGCEYKPLCLASDEEKPYIIEMQYEAKKGVIDE